MVDSEKYFALEETPQTVESTDWQPELLAALYGVEEERAGGTSGLVDPR